jgi:mRNA interferase HigB
MKARTNRPPRDLARDPVLASRQFLCLTFAKCEVEWFFGRIAEATMRVISRKKLREAWTLCPDLKPDLDAWFRVAQKASWGRFSDVRATFKSVDRVDKYFVFNILGNRYRLICSMSFGKGKVYMLRVMTHAEYDRDKWKSG